MGAVVDTSVFIAYERRGGSGAALRDTLVRSSEDDLLVLSSVSLAELVHGMYRAFTPEQYENRAEFVRGVLRSFPVLSFDKETSWTAGKVRGEQSRIGNTLPFADSLIAATAMELDYAVITTNLKDFLRIPGLRVIPFVFL